MTVLAMLNPTQRLLAPPYSLLLSLVYSLAFCSLASAEIYSWTDESGNIIYSDQKPSEQAKPTQSSAKINYYTPTTKTKSQQTKGLQTKGLAVLSAEAESAEKTTANIKQSLSEESESEGELTEAQCQQRYQRSCDKVNNWQQDARKACGDDARCDDENFLENKYRPRSQEELLAIARRAATRNNMADKKITQFLIKKYSNYCKNQAAMVCQKKRNKQCQKALVKQCKDSRSLEDIFQHYDNLSAIEKKEIIEKAKAMALANGDDELNYGQMLTSLMEILISRTTMGL